MSAQRVAKSSAFILRSIQTGPFKPVVPVQIDPVCHPEAFARHRCFQSTGRQSEHVLQYLHQTPVKLQTAGIFLPGRIPQAQTDIGAMP
ncbi:hypothetical protein D3C87_1823870 [compost metagenome]